MLTKTTTLISIPLVLVAVVLTVGHRPSAIGHRPSAIGYPLFAIFLPALLLTLPWFVRNAYVYGGLDILGWTRHDAVVVGQPRTTEWLAQYGVVGLAKDFLLTTFRSFWAQFGWMGVLVDSRLYMVLAVISIIVVLGLILFLTRIARNRLLLTFFQWSALGLLLMIFVETTAEHVSYNLKFVQHQGRYLFPGLISIGLAFALGLREWVSIVARRLSRLPPLAPFVSELNSIGKGLVLFLLYGGFLALDVVCLYVFIVPYFQA
jgi:hypothetical protein